MWCRARGFCCVLLSMWNADGTSTGEVGEHFRTTADPLNLREKNCGCLWWAGSVFGRRSHIRASHLAGCHGLLPALAAWLFCRVDDRAEAIALASVPIGNLRSATTAVDARAYTSPRDTRFDSRSMPTRPPKSTASSPRNFGSPISPALRCLLPMTPNQMLARFLRRTSSGTATQQVADPRHSINLRSDSVRWRNVSCPTHFYEGENKCDVRCLLLLRSYWYWI